MKTKTQTHTPGPWQLSGHEVIVKNHGSVAIATTDIGMVATKEEREANARLIAAAPELLSALENAEASIELVRCLDAGEAIDTEADNMLDSLQNRIRAAIAKAKAAQP